jgi:ubiquinone/menaquinone biosynthesis C-methylase UbiE
MNRFHRWYCASTRWARYVESSLVPWGLDGVNLGSDVLEIGPGLGVTTRVVARRVPQLTVVELDGRLAAELQRKIGSTVRVVHGDATTLPFKTASFTGAACFTVLHHVPSTALQDRLFAEVRRVLLPGAIFAGTDSQPSWRFRLIHLFDTMVPVDPHTLSSRLQAAGFTDIRVAVGASGVRFAARAEP